MQWDVIVVGLGAMGSHAAWRLAARGARVLGLEQFTPGHNQGSSHGESRIIRTAYFSDPRYVPLAQAAFPLWRQLEAESGDRLLTMTGALMIGAPDSRVVRGALASAHQHGLAHELLDAAAVEARYPQHRLAPGEVAVQEAAAGVLRPEVAIRAAAARAVALGAEIRTGTTVRQLRPIAGGIEVETDDGSFSAPVVIAATGAWTGPLLPDLRLPLQVERQVLAWFPVADPALYDPARCPVYIHEIGPGRYRYGFPTLDGATVKIAVDHDGQPTTADTLDRTTHPADLAPITAFIRAHLAGVTPEAVRTQVCMYTNTPDEHFLLGTPAGWPGLILLGGCSGHSFKFASVMGDAAADLALTGRTAYPVGFFDPNRL
jgi:sarcosine oxidase